MNKKGQMGIEALVIFIAVVIIVAIAAGVLLGTTDVLQSKATASGFQTTRATSTKLQVDKIIVNVSNVNNPADFMRIQVETVPGSSPVELSTLLMQMQGIDPTGKTWYIENILYNSAYGVGDTPAVPSSATQFNVVWVKNTTATGSGSNTRTNLLPGEIVELWWNSSISPYLVDTNTQIKVELRPASGQPSSVSFTTPAAWYLGPQEVYPGSV